MMSSVQNNRQQTKTGSFVPGQYLRLLRGGKSYFQFLIRLIDQAKEQVHLQVYIFAPDETGQLVADALIRAARRGVDVYVLVDGYGSQALDRSFVRQFKTNGVHFRVFEPLFRSRHFYIGRRMHQKLLVVDARYAIVTGANVGNHYHGQDGDDPWLDFALAVSGDVAIQFCRLCWTTWYNFRPSRRGSLRCVPVIEDGRQEIDFGWQGQGAVRLRRNDWVRRKYEISRTYRELFRKANKNVIVVSSYFLPGRTVQRDIEDATRRGVRVQVIICGRMDVPLVKDAERYMYGWLLRHGVEIYEYKGTMLHGKLATCDRDWMTIGSFNVNDLSARVSVELNADVADGRFVDRTVDQLRGIMVNDCEYVDPVQFQRKSHLLVRFIRWLSYKLLRVFYFIGTFYMRQERRPRD